jgi:hypothetical protein
MKSINRFILCIHIFLFFMRIFGHIEVEFIEALKYFES